MDCCDQPDFERHSDPAVADIGKSRGIEFTVGRCRNCSSLLIHSWAGGVAGGLRTVSREQLERIVAADGEARKVLLAEWSEADD